MIQNFVSKLSAKQKTLLYVTVGILTLALLDGLFFRPVFNSIGRIGKKINEQKITIKQDFHILGHKEKIYRQSKELGKYFVQKFEDDDVINREFLSVIEKLATDTKVSLVKSNPSETKKNDNYIEYFAQLDCVGELKDVISFMHAINSTEQLLKVVQFSVAPKRGSQTEVNSSLRIVRLVMLTPQLTENVNSNPQ